MSSYFISKRYTTFSISYQIIAILCIISTINTISSIYEILNEV
jgi:hypothetical protein